jgi:hypothetical protein
MMGRGTATTQITEAVMNKIVLVSALLCALSAWAGESGSRRDLVTSVFRFGQLGRAAPSADALMLEPFLVDGRSSKISEKIADALANYLNNRQYVDPRTSVSKIYFVGDSSYAIPNRLLDDAKRIASKENAKKYLGGMEVFKNGTFYFHGGLMRSFSKDISLGVKSIGHGAIGLICDYHPRRFH